MRIEMSCLPPAEEIYAVLLSRDTMNEKEKKQCEELAELKRKNKELQKELNRKDKALAETAALLALKKKPTRSVGRNIST